MTVARAIISPRLPAEERDPDGQRYRTGDAVEARFQKGKQWFGAKVTREYRSTNTYDLLFDDGDEESGVAARYMKRKAGAEPRIVAPRARAELESPVASAAYRAGDRVEARFRGGEAFHPARIAKVHADGSLDLHYLDGDKESDVAPRLVRRAEGRAVSTPSRGDDGGARQTFAERFNAGDEVEARFKGGAQYHAARVGLRHADGTYDLLYDDGDREARVPAALIRPRAAAAARAERRRPPSDDSDDGARRPRSGSGGRPRSGSDGARPRSGSGDRAPRASDADGPTELEDKFMEAGISLISKEARADLRAWATTSRKALVRVFERLDERATAREWRRAAKDADLPARLGDALAALLDCCGKNVACLEVLDFISLPPETKRVAAVRKRLSAAVKLRSRSGDADAFTQVSSATEARGGVCAAGDLRRALLRDGGRPKFASAIESLFSDRDADEVSRHFGPSCDVSAFCRWCAAPPSRAATQAVAQAKVQLGMAAVASSADGHKKWLRKTFDVGKTGLCDSEDLRIALAAGFCLPLTVQEVDSLVAPWSRFYDERSGKVDYETMLFADGGGAKKKPATSSDEDLPRRRLAASDDSDEADAKKKPASMWSRFTAAKSPGRSESPPARRRDENDDGPALLSGAAFKILAKKCGEVFDRLSALDRVTGRDVEKSVRKLGLDEADEAKVLQVVAPRGAKGDCEPWADFCDFCAGLGAPVEDDDFSAAEAGYRKLRRRGFRREDALAALEAADTKDKGMLKKEEFARALEKKPFRFEGDASKVGRPFEVAAARFSAKAVRHGAFARWLTADAADAAETLGRALRAMKPRDAARVVDRLPADRGAVDFGDLYKFVQKARLPLSAGQVRALCDDEATFAKAALLKLLDADSDDASASEDDRRRAKKRGDDSDDSAPDRRRDDGEAALLAASLQKQLAEWVRAEGRRGLAKIFAKLCAVGDVFRLGDRLDRDDLGSLDSRDVRRLLAKARVDATENEFDALFELLDGDGDGQVDYAEFANFALSFDERDDDEGHAALQLLQRKLFRKMDSAPDLQRALKKCDTVRAVAKALTKALGVELKSKDRELLASTFGYDGRSGDDAQVDARGLAAWLCVDVDRVAKRVRHGLALYTRKVGDSRAAFCGLAGCKKGLTPESLHAALRRKLLLPVSRAEAAALFDAYDADGDGALDLEEFFDLAAAAKVPAKKRRKKAASSSGSDDDRRVAKKKPSSDSDSPPRGRRKAQSSETESDGGRATKPKDESGDSREGSDEEVFEQALVSRALREALQAWARRERSGGRRGGLKNVFLKADKDGSGRLTRAEFVKVVSRALADDRLDARAIDDVADVMDADGDGAIDYVEFARFVDSARGDSPALIKLRHKLRAKLLKRRGGAVSTAKRFLAGGRASSALDVCAVLGAVDGDDDRKGVLSAGKFRRALAKPPLSFDEVLKTGDASLLSKRFRASDKGDDVDYGAFARWLGADAAGSSHADKFDYAGLDAGQKRKRLGLASTASRADYQKALEARLGRRAELKVRKALKVVAQRARNGGDDVSASALRKKFFGALDKNGDGALSRKELASAFARLGLPLSSDEAHALFDKYDRDGDGTVSYKEFKELLFSADDDDDGKKKKSSKKADDKKKPDGDAADDGADVSKLARKLRRALRGDGEGAGRDWGAELSAAFANMDVDGDGDVDPAELSAWLEKALDLRLGKAEQATLLECFDTDANGKISYEEFVGFALEPPKGGRELAAVAEKLRSALGVEGCAALRAALQRADKDRSGHVKPKALWRAVGDVVGEGRLDLTRDEQGGLAARFASKEDGDQVRYVHLCTWLESGLAAAAVSKLRSRLRALGRRRGRGRIDARTVFRDAASSNKGTLSLQDLGKACERCGVLLSGTALDAVMKAFDADGDGTVDWGEFKKAVFDDAPAAGNKGGGAGGDGDAHLATALEAIFTAFDADGDGRISKAELKALAPHILRAFALEPDGDELKALERHLKAALADGHKSMTYADFEQAALTHVRKALAQRAHGRAARGAIFAQLRAALADLDGVGDGSVARADFEKLCAGGALGALTKNEAETLARVCSASAAAVTVRGDAGGKSAQQRVCVEEVLRLVEAARGGADAAAAAVRAAPYSASAVKSADATDVAASAVLKLLHGPKPDPSRYLLAFAHPSSFGAPLLPNSFREPPTARLARQPTRTLAAAVAPQAVLAARGGAADGEAPRPLVVTLLSATAVPAPAALDDKRFRGVARRARCCLVRTSPGGGDAPRLADEAVMSNVETLAAAPDAYRPDCWAFVAEAPAVEGPRRARVAGDVAQAPGASVVAMSSPQRPAADGGGGGVCLLVELSLSLPQSFFRHAASDAQSRAKSGRARGTQRHQPAGKDKSSDADSDDDAGSASSSSGYGDSSEDDSKKKKKAPEKKKKKSASSDDDDDDGGKKKRKAKAKKPRRRAKDDEDGVYSDSDSAASEKPKPKDSDDEAEPKKDKPAWFDKKIRRTKARKPKAESSDAPAAADFDDDDGGDYVEVSCGWAVVPLDGRSGVLTLELKGGSPFAEDAIAVGDIPWRHRGWHRQLQQTVFGYDKRPRVRVRIGAAAPELALPRAALVPLSAAPLVATYVVYLEAYLGRHVSSSTSSRIADPVLALFPRLVASGGARTALDALWRARLAAQLDRLKPPVNAATRAAAAQAALQQAVVELWPLCEARRASAAELSLKGVARQAAKLLEQVGLHDAGDSDDGAERPRRRQDSGAYTPFNTRELIPDL